VRVGVGEVVQPDIGQAQAAVCECLPGHVPGADRRPQGGALGGELALPVQERGERGGKLPGVGVEPTRAGPLRKMMSVTASGSRATRSVPNRRGRRQFCRHRP